MALDWRVWLHEFQTGATSVCPCPQSVEFQNIIAKKIQKIVSVSLSSIASFSSVQDVNDYISVSAQCEIWPGVSGIVIHYSEIVTITIGCASVTVIRSPEVYEDPFHRSLCPSRGCVVLLLNFLRPHTDDTTSIIGPQRGFLSPSLASSG